jgi:hypothetical protein
MYFAELQQRLLEHLRLRVRNGELTERGLAKLVGVSQPHIHNVLKGRKILSQEICDRVLASLQITLLDLIDRETLTLYLQTRTMAPGTAWVRVLDTPLGPGHPWPNRATRSERFAISPADLTRMAHPIAARLGEEPRMKLVFSAGEWVILDQSVPARREPTPDGYYLVRVGGEPLVRHVRLLEKRLYLVTEDALRNPAEWQRVDTANADVSHIIRARIRFVTLAGEWQD